MDISGSIVHDEFKKLMNLISRYTRANQISKEHNVTRTQALILEFIYENTKDGKNIYQKDIESHFAIRRSTATESLKKLEAQGMLTRVSSLKDARLKETHLTEKAKHFIANAHSQLTDISSIICKKITDKEIETVYKVIKKMQKNLKEFSSINA